MQILAQFRALIIPRVYEVNRGYIAFAFSVIMLVCLFVCKLFFCQRFLSNYLTKGSEIWYKA